MYISSIYKDEKVIEKRVSSRARKAVGLCLLACALMLLIQLVVVFAIQLTDFSDEVSEILDDEIYYLYFNIAVYCVCIIAPFTIISLIFKFLFKNTDSKLIKRPHPKNPLLYIAGTLGIGYSVNLILSLCFTDFVERYTIESDFLPVTPYGIVLMYISNAVLPAILEEWAFRGVICKNLLPYGRKGAIIISSLMFGIMHIDPPRIIFTTAIGIMLAVCYEHTGSLVLPMLIHFVNNAFSTTIALFVDTSDESAVTAGALIASLMIYVFIGCGVATLIYYKKHGFSVKSFSLRRTADYGYKLPAGKYILRMFLNAGIIPLAVMYSYFYYLYYIA